MTRANCRPLVWGLLFVSIDISSLSAFALDHHEAELRGGGNDWEGLAS
jgi:hypothetical protein